MKQKHIYGLLGVFLLIMGPIARSHGYGGGGICALASLSGIALIFVALAQDDECRNVPECEYNYHDPVHSDVCHFECMLDAYLEPDCRLTPDAQEYRDELIIGVERMMEKVEGYKKSV